MSKVKHLLRKLHIGDHHSHQPPGRATPSDPSPSATSASSGSTTSASSPSDAPPPPAVAAAAVVENESTVAADNSFNFFEEEFQVQLALAISVSDPGRVVDDPETAQINAAKQISLGCTPSQSLPEFQSLRYWSYNVVNYDEKVIDGFYDVCGIDSNLVVQAKMPSLVDIGAISVSDNVGYVVVLVNRVVDLELRKLEEIVDLMSMECLALDRGPNTNILVQKIADLVVNRMGGPVHDAEEMSRKWRMRSYDLRIFMNTIVLPLGSLDVGHSRHRALLFKVLADRIGLPCKLVKGSYYTGTDEGAVNLIKLENGSEYILDLMGAPGTLIPAEVPSYHQQSIGLEARSTIRPAGNTKHSSASLDGIGTRLTSCIAEKIHIEQVEHDLGDNNLSLGGAIEVPSSAYKKNSTQGFLLNITSNDRRKDQVSVETGLVGGERVINSERHPEINVSRQEQALVPSTVGQLQNIQCDDSRRYPGEGLVAVNQLKIEYSGSSPANNLYFNTVNQEHLLLKDEMFQNDDNLVGGNQTSVFGENDDFFMQGRETVCSDQSNPSSDCNSQIDRVLDGVAEILWEDLQIGERIGIGSYGEVYRAEWNGTEVAVKKFMNQDFSGDALAKFKCEVEIMLRLRHPNVVLFMGAVLRPPNLSILTEFLPRGSLYRLLHRQNIHIDEKRRIKMALDVAKGMNYLHTSHPIIVHRDLKTPNLLVDKNWVVKVCDFGMSRLQHSTFLSSKSAAGTAEWMAPEVLRNEPSNEKSDVYSFGVILWELATLKVPWMELNSMQVIGAVGFQDKHLQIPPTVDPVVADIITDCWNRNPQARPSFGQIITRLKSLHRLSVQRTTDARTYQL